MRSCADCVDILAVMRLTEGEKSDVQSRVSGTISPRRSPQCRAGSQANVISMPRLWKDTSTD